jgi:hypothetical protein
MVIDCGSLLGVLIRSELGEMEQDFLIYPVSCPDVQVWAPYLEDQRFLLFAGNCEHGLGSLGLKHSSFFKTGTFIDHEEQC